MARRDARGRFCAGNGGGDIVERFCVGNGGGNIVEYKKDDGAATGVLGLVTTTSYEALLVPVKGGMSLVNVTQTVAQEIIYSPAHVLIGCVIVLCAWSFLGVAVCPEDEPSKAFGLRLLETFFSCW